MPGNVLVMSEGSTDELFSNLARGDATNVERVTIASDQKGPADRPGGGRARGDHRARTAARRGCRSMHPKD